MDEAAWHRWRSEGVGASDVARAMGAYGWTPQRVVDDKVDPAPVTPYQQRLFDAGHDAEPVILDAVEVEFDGIVAGRQSAWEHPKHPHRRCTLDGVLVDDDWAGLDTGTIVEAKWTRSANPGWVHYRTQVQYQMAVTGHGAAIIAVQWGSKRPVTELVLADDVFGRKLLLLADDLWAAVVAARDRAAVQNP